MGAEGDDWVPRAASGYMSNEVGLSNANLDEVRALLRGCTAFCPDVLAAFAS